MSHTPLRKSFSDMWQTWRSGLTPSDYALEALIDRAGREQVYAEVVATGWREAGVVPHQVWRDAANAVLERNQNGVHGEMNGNSEGQCTAK